MQPHHRSHIVKAEPIALHVVQVAVGHTVELVEDMLLMSFGDTYSVVANPDNYIVICVFRARDSDSYFLARILNGIVEDIAYNLSEVLSVGIYYKVFRNNIKRKVNRPLRLQLLFLYYIGKRLAHFQRFFVQREGLAAFHACG